MKIAKLCEKWDLPFYADLESEDSTSLHNRSYIHYVAEHQPLVSAKCWATDWGLTDILDPSTKYTSREYFAGVGVMTTIITNKFNISKSIISERDPECVFHLRKNGWTCYHEDAKKSLLEECNDYDLKFLDFPNSSIIHIQTTWKEGFEAAFNSKPKLVMWTDTSVTYPITIHGEKYAKRLGIESLSSKIDYIKAYSDWLYKNYNYSIKKAAFRAKNAVYFFAIPGKHETIMKHFEPSYNGFYFIGEKGGIYDYTE